MLNLKAFVFFKYVKRFGLSHLQPNKLYESIKLSYTLIQVLSIHVANL